MSDLTDIINYYANLLIVQYKTKDKAKETIKALIKQIYSDLIALSVRDGFNPKTAIGDQLDILAKYSGAKRNFNGVVFDKLFFEFVTTDDVYPEGFGFSTVGDLQEGGPKGFITSYDASSSSYSVTDEELRLLISLKGIQNNSNHSMSQIDNRIYDLFDGDIIPYNGFNMTMTYVFPESQSNLLKIVKSKNYLPKPMGVGIIFVIAIDNIENVFGFRTTSNPDIPNGGFSLTSDLQDGAFLSDDNINT